MAVLHIFYYMEKNALPESIRNNTRDSSGIFSIAFPERA